MTTPHHKDNETQGQGEELALWRKRLIFRSWHRGTREMDLLMGSFADRHIPEFGELELTEYDSLLQCSDPKLYDWISGRETLPSNAGNVLQMLREHTFAGKR